MTNAATNPLPDPEDEEGEQPQTLTPEEQEELDRRKAIEELERDALAQRKVIAEIELVIDTGKRREFTVPAMEQFVDQVTNVLIWVRNNENNPPNYKIGSEAVSELLREARNPLDHARNELGKKGFTDRFTNKLDEAHKKLKSVLDAW
jgi:hypothetical protein